MSLQEWRNNGWLRVHKPTRQEIADLLAIAERDIKDAKAAEVSSDWRFGIALQCRLETLCDSCSRRGLSP